MGDFPDISACRRLGIPVPTKLNWSDRPATPDQAAEMPHTVRVGPPRVQVFDLSKPDDIKAYHALMDRTVPRKAPSVVVLREHINFYDGKYVQAVWYSELEYLKLSASQDDENDDYEEFEVQK